MKPIVKLVSLFLLAALVFVPLQSASAKGLLDGQVIFGQSYTLKSGETLIGDLVVFGGSANIEKGATAKGNVMVFGGTLVINGDVTGDAAIVGGSVDLGAESHIYGDLATVGATLTRADGAQIDGQITNTATSWNTDGNNGTAPVEPTTPSIPEPNIDVSFHPLASIMNTFGQAFLLALLAMLLMLFLAPHADRVAHAVFAHPLTAGGIGLLTLFAAPIALAALALLTLLIITAFVTVPAIIILAVALGMASVFGWIALGYEIGQRLVGAFHQEWHPAFSAGLGTFLLTLIANGASILNFLPGMQCITWILPTVVGLFGLGAVIMTRFGTQAVAPVVKAEVVPVQPAEQKPQ